MTNPVEGCEVKDCPQYNEFSCGCRLSQLEKIDERYKTPDQCSHRRFILKEREKTI